jgi:hypothetical protein
VIRREEGKRKEDERWERDEVSTFDLILNIYHLFRPGKAGSARLVMDES